MATRLSFRPRPVDVNKQLTIVRDVSELDREEGGSALDAETQLPEQIVASQPPPTKKQKPKEIPVPDIGAVPTYTRDYLPLFHHPDTYIRGKGGVGYKRDDYVEYDLDNEDEDWLMQYNRGRNALNDVKFEQMLWRLELACAEATDRALTMAGASAAEKNMPAALSTTQHLLKDEAIALLRKVVGARDQILEAVFDYWANKRKRWGKPILRRLQPPTNPSDTNPFNVFRPREKVNRPQTRRRRENSMECIEKMRMIRENLLKALETAELVGFRERKKRDILRIDVDMQRYQLNLQHQPRQFHEAVEKEAAIKLQESMVRSSQGESRLKAYLDGANSMTPLLDSPTYRTLVRRRKRQEAAQALTLGEINGDAIAKLPPPPLPPDNELVFAMHPDPERLAPLNALLYAYPAAKRRRCWRLARSGRVMLVRADPLTLELYGVDREDGEQSGVQEDQAGTSEQQQQQPAGPKQEPAAAAAAGEGLPAPLPGNGNPFAAAAAAASTGALNIDALGAGSEASTSAAKFPACRDAFKEPWAAVLDIGLIPECLDPASVALTRASHQAHKIAQAAAMCPGVVIHCGGPHGGSTNGYGGLHSRSGPTGPGAATANNRKPPHQPLLSPPSALMVSRSPSPAPPLLSNRASGGVPPASAPGTAGPGSSPAWPTPPTAPKSQAPAKQSKQQLSQLKRGPGRPPKKHGTDLPIPIPMDIS